MIIGILASGSGNSFHALARACAEGTVDATIGVVISNKTAAQMVPVAGALSAGLMNLIFMNHYQDVARGHFIIRRLERTHGIEQIKQAYEELMKAEEDTADYSPVDGW